MLRRGGTWLAAALVATAVTAVPATPAAAVDPACPFTTGTVYTWDGSASNSWGIAANWDRNEVPNENTSGDATPETTDTYVCIPAGSSVVMDETDLSNHSLNQVDVRALYLGAGAALVVPQGVGLFVMHHTVESVTAPGSQITVVAGSLGGEGTLRAHGTVSVSGTSAFGSALISASFAQPVLGQPGRLLIDTDGLLQLPSYGINLVRQYRVEVAGYARMSGNGFLGVGFDSQLKIDPGGTYELGGVGGFYEGAPPQGVPNSVVSLVNNGRLLKSGAGTTSVIGSDYSQTGVIQVTGGTLAFAGGTVYTAQVSPGQQLSTAKCAPRAPTEPCRPELDPSRDAQSVAFTVPPSDADGAVVTVLENAQPASAVVANGIGNVFTAHADGLGGGAADPALIEFRVGVPLAGTTNPDQVSVVHEADDGTLSVLPGCLANGRPASGLGCVDRRGAPGSSRVEGDNLYLVVRTTETSRYICRKEPVDLVAPIVTAPATAPKTKLGKPIMVTTTLSEASTVTVKGKIKAKGVRGLRLRPTSAQGQGGAPTAIKVRLGKLKRKLRHAGVRKAKAKLLITAVDAAGNAAPLQRLTVRLR